MNESFSKVKNISGMLDFNWNEETDDPLYWASITNSQNEFSMV
ncbi:hypothetical protein [Bacillus massilioanorexius]|nr:hypothetical protein [Bacillus massilioanorexius]